MKGLGYLSLSVLFSFLSFLSIAQSPINDAILIDFGNNISPAPWNNLADPDKGIIENLTNESGQQTAYGIRVFDEFNGINTNGTIEPDPAINYPATATGDSFFGNIVEFSKRTELTGGVELFSLKTEKKYKIQLFASRSTPDNRQTQYIIQGENIDTIYLNISSNSERFVTATLKPTEKGTIKVIASPGPKNNNSYNFYYLGAMKVTYAEEDPYGRYGIKLVAPNGGEYWQVGKTASIKWENQNLEDVLLEYSTDSGSSWSEITTVPAYKESYEWTIPNTPSEECLVRISSDTLMNISEDVFEITADTTTYTIVVLGSSTAEGTGASSPESCWVTLYANSLSYNTRYKVINLARGGYTTYHILPTGSTIPAEVNITIDEERNVSKALSYAPSVIIVNMPSNDANRNFSPIQQMNNFQNIIDAGIAGGASVYLATTQPRNFKNKDQIRIQEEVRDSILAIYKDYAIDFWTGIADENGFILEKYNSGDGVHLNDKGHSLLFERVHGKSIAN